MCCFDLSEFLSIDVVDRLWWGDLKSKEENLVKYTHPVKYLRFTYDDFDRGENPDLIDAMMKWEKRLMEDEGLVDIPYNFMIGEHSIVYEGRGWYHDADRPAKYADLKGQCLDFAYVGDFSEKEPCWEMIYLAHNLILYGIKENFIAQDVKIIPYDHDKPRKFS